LESCGFAGDYGSGLAGKQAQKKAGATCLFRAKKAKQ
jgi:hypothetical protein